MNKIIVILFLLLGINGYSQENHGLVKWMTINEALRKNEALQRPILIDFYTDWCGWCKTMVKTTYSDSAIANYINEFFYPVQFNAEGKDTVRYLGEVFVPVGPGPRITHPFAQKMLGDKLMYPTTVFLNGFEKEKNTFRLNLTAPGYLDQKNIQPLLVYTVEGVFRNCAPADFQKDFEKAFYDSLTNVRANRNTWLTPDPAFVHNSTGKKTLVLLSTNWCNSCKVMKNGVFADSAVQSKVNKYFRLVEMDATTEDTIYYGKDMFISPAKGQFHQLALALTKDKLALPSVCVIDENNMLVDVLSSFVSSNFLPDILEYYGGNHYKTKSWVDFQKSIH